MQLTTRPKHSHPGRSAPRSLQAFTLVEIIGVLAVIAILAALLIPRIFEAVNNARINNAVIACTTVRAAVADHYAKFGSLAVDGTVTPPQPITNLPAAKFDQLLLREAFLDKPFLVKIGDGNPDNTTVQLRQAVPGSIAANASNAAYDLAGMGGTNTATGSVVVEAVISNVLINDAKDLNERLDGNNLAGPAEGDDLKGRVKYAYRVPATTVYVYLTHR